jgi:hypothetical protein
MFRAPPRPSSRAYNCINSLWFYLGALVLAALLFVVWQITTNNVATNNVPTVKPEAVNSVVSS